MHCEQEDIIREFSFDPELLYSRSEKNELDTCKLNRIESSSTTISDIVDDDTQKKCAKEHCDFVSVFVFNDKFNLNENNN